MKHILTLLVATCLSIIPISLFAAPVSEPITRTANDREFLFESPWLKVAFSREQPKMTYLSVDSLGTGRHHRNLLKAPAGAGPVWKFGVPGGGSPPYAAIQRGNEIRYQPLGARDDPQMSFTISVEPKVIVVAIETGLPGSPGGPGISPWSMVFDATVTPASPLGRTVPDPFPSGREEKAGAPERTTATTLRNVLQGPVLLHFPDWGSLLLNTRAKPALEEAFWRCSLLRDLKPIAPGTVAEWRKMTPAERKTMEAIGNPYLLAWDNLHIGPEQLQMSLCATPNARSKAKKHRTEVTMTVAAIYPQRKMVDADPKLHGLKRAWLNIFGFRPDLGCLANNSTGDACQFCLHCYADQAFFTPPLFGGFTALDLVRSSLDRYLGGLKGYSDGFQDVAPSTIIAAWDYVVGRPDPAWLRQHIVRLEEYGDRIVRMDTDGDGLGESPVGPTNWWDLFAYGGKDAYSSALAWRAFRCLADLETRLGDARKATFYQARADKIREVYYSTFYNPETGVLAGWRTKDGHLKDNYFLWANGIAIAYGLVPPPQANAILDRLQGKIREVGFTNFQYGLPGNLVSAGREFPIAPGVFPVYENGGATGSMAYYYLQALYARGRRSEADAIFDRMLEGYQAGAFQNGIGNGGDWKVWNGTPTGYEGMLVDAYYPLTAWITGHLGKGVPLPGGLP